jgi:hypothetical protein
VPANSDALDPNQSGEVDPPKILVVHQLDLPAGSVDPLRPAPSGLTFDQLFETNLTF